MTNGEIARVFTQLATMLEMDAANPFRVRAYREAARVIGEQAKPVAAFAAEAGRLEAIPGIGKDLAQKIRDLIATGSFATFDEMKAKYPLEVVALTELPGVGPKRVRLLFEKLNVRSRADLERLAREGKLRALAGFGEVMEQKVLKALSTAEQFAGRLLLAGAWPAAHALAEHVRNVTGVGQVEIAGSFRRRKETVGDLDLLVSGGEAERVMQAFTSHPEVAEVLGRGGTKSSVRLKNGLQVDLRLVPEVSFGAAMMYFTGSKAHNIELRKIAIEKGYLLNEYGLMKGERVVAGRTEEEVYRALGMSWIPPELREAMDEIDLAIEGRLPELIEERDLKADLHIHTNRTDGRESIETMVRTLRDRGYEYCAITDHSRSLTMARGFDEARVRQSVDEIAAVRRQVPGIEILHGLEVDILADGSLDLGDEGLALLDWVIVSLHSRLDQPGPEITERVLRALSHPAVHVMGHPTARYIGSRAPAALDLDRVFARAAELGVLMEINAQPERIDLSDVNARLAKEKGLTFVIDTDGHSIPQLDNMRYGVFAARRAGLTRQDVLNTLPSAEFRRRLRTPGRPAAAAPKAVTGTRGPGPKGTATKGTATKGGATKGTAPKGTARAARPTPPKAAKASRTPANTTAAKARARGATRPKPSATSTRRKPSATSTRLKPSTTAARRKPVRPR